MAERTFSAISAAQDRAPAPAGARTVVATVVIRARDEARHLGTVLARVAEQTTRDHAVLVIDSGSRDGTPQIAAQAGATVVGLAPEAFSYGRALNLGVRLAQSEIVVFLSAHAVPAHERWLEALLAPFADPAVAGVFGRQLAHPGCHPFEQFELLRAYGAEARRYARDPRFSNANAAVRRSVALALPFDEQIAYAEDLVWARQVCATGLQVAYAPEAAVLHSHDEGFAPALRRQRREVAATLGGLGGTTVLRHAWLVPFAWGFGVARDWLRLGRSGAALRWYPRALVWRAAKVLGAWLGCRDHARGAR